MIPHDPEDERLRSAALQNEQSIFRARRRAEEELRKQSEWFRVTLASIGDAVISSDREGRVSFMNRVAETLTGWTQDEALGHPLHDVFRIINEHTRAVVENPALRALRDGVIVGLANHTLLIAKDGTERPIDDSAAPIRASDGECLGCILVFRDVSDRHRADKERDELIRSERAARAEAENAGRLKEEFLATLSHELRTPLSAMLGWIQILRRKPSPENLEQGILVLDRNARMQAQLIADLLDMSRIVAGKLRLDVQPVELPVVIEAALDAVRSAADGRGIVLHHTFEQFTESVYGDPARLQQVVWNLLSNAVKFTPRGGRVQIDLARVGSTVQLSVMDTGHGIKPEFLPHVFERFRQADSSAAREHGGLGLGLAIVKQLVELHGGTVHAASGGEGKGATFTVALPVAAQRVEKTQKAAPVAASAASPEWDLPDLRGVRVLIVDDDPDARDLIQRVLEESGAEIAPAASAAEGLTVLSSGRVNVILSDIGLPGCDGYHFMREVRKRGIRTPAAAITAFARSEDRTRALNAGYQTHIAKPVEPSELLATVAALAHKTRAEKTDGGERGSADPLR
ncbi:MAG: ATP-binding protein [Planctomycetota bacterium]